MNTRRESLCELVLTVWLLGGAAVVDSLAAEYSIHEWGTFTSAQGADGILLPWHSVRTEELPVFVHSWGSKYSLLALQRMETPVIYFYGNQRQTVEVKVQFPYGQFTEWYPLATESRGNSATEWIERATNSTPGMSSNGIANVLAGYAARLPQDFPPATADVGDRLTWNGVTLAPAKENSGLSGRFPTAAAGGRYFSARETDSACLEVPSATNGVSEYEKFLFYRGVADFKTPLQVTMNTNGVVMASNLSARDTLRHLYLLSVRGGEGSLTALEEIAPGKAKSMGAPERARKIPVAGLSDQLGTLMTAALEKEGLYPREAVAMVKTWKDSWFAEEGIRVLYILPQSWTERALPLTLSPPPARTVRVMVGRAEVIAPDVVEQLQHDLSEASGGSEAHRQSAEGTVAKLGRFAEPTLLLASERLDAKSVQLGQTLLKTTAPELASR
jgi:hypothetical protein